MAAGDAPRTGDRARVRRLVVRDMEHLRPGEQRAWWLRDALAADPGQVCPPPSRDVEADVVIVGGGYTGLWTAWWLTEQDPDLRVVILEADIVGGGASGRNGGFLTGWWDDLTGLVHSFGRDAGLAAAMALDGVPAWIGAWAERHGVDAGWRPGGTLVASSSPVQDDAWGATLTLAAELGVADRFLPLSPADVRARSGSPVLRGGVLIPSDASVQPARLARGLRRVLLARGVTIHEGTKVAGITTDDDRVRVRTSLGPEVRAAHAVLAVNAWAAGWPGAGFGSRMITWSSYMVLTEPVPERLAAIGWTGGEAITDCRFSNHYFRTTADGRIAFVSERCGYSLQCNHDPRLDETSCNLYVMQADGSGIRRLSVNKDGDYLPHCLDDGTIGYTRWEYQERNLTQIQS
ncbi:MAG: FAD-dependent oxidoreductase, partial [Chloroflexota bacterium]